MKASLVAITIHSGKPVAMLAGPLVFVDIDTQRDFLEPGGALFIAGSELVLANLARLTDCARRQGIPVLATACAHGPDDPELAQFGPHCLIGAPGQQRIAATAWPGGRVLGPDDRLQDEDRAGAPFPAHLTVEKRELDLFTHPEADRLIAWYDRDQPTFVVYGVATDYCVRCAVLGLLDRGCRVAVVADAIRAIDPDAEADIVAEFVRRGALLTVTAVVCED